MKILFVINAQLVEDVLQALIEHYSCQIPPLTDMRKPQTVKGWINRSDRGDAHPLELTITLDPFVRTDADRVVRGCSSLRKWYSIRHEEGRFVAYIRPCVPTKSHGYSATERTRSRRHRTRRKRVGIPRYYDMPFPQKVAAQIVAHLKSIA